MDGTGGKGPEAVDDPPPLASIRVARRAAGFEPPTIDARARAAWSGVADAEGSAPQGPSGPHEGHHSDGFLSVLSAATIALALLADATGFGPQTTTLALVLLPVVLFLGIAAHGRLVEINREEVELVLAMNRCGTPT